MYSIENNIENTIIIKKSKFICKIFRIQNEEEVILILNNLRNDYKDATHICYSYICENKVKNNDDGEPAGTAGMPIYNVLKKNNLNMILCCVIRYFGGIKLGAGGLTRAYSNSVIEALKLANIINLVDGYNIQIEFNYENTKNIDNILKNFNITNKIYDDNIKYIIEISTTNYNNIYNELKKYCIQININKKILVKN